MAQETHISASKKVLYISITVILLLFITEGLLSMVLYQRSGTEKLASIEALKKIKKRLVSKESSLNVNNHDLVRPDSLHDVNYKIAEEVIASNKFVYESWVEYKIMDFQGKYMNISKLMRKSNPEAFINPAGGDTLDVYFFGGSTMFGFNVLDHETLPSQFLQMYKDKYPMGKSMRVFNYGIPTFYSYQELMLLSNLIYDGHKPSLIIFMDGLNDFWFATASYYRQSYFSYIFRQIFNQGMRTKGEFRFIDSAEAMFRDPDYIPRDQFNNTLVRNYIHNMKNAAMMAEHTGAQVYFFCQPSPFYNYPNQQKDPMCFKDTNTRFNNIYPMLEKKADSLYHFSFMGNMLKHEKNYPFVDGLHYSPGFIKKITGSIFSTVEKELQ